MIVNHKFSNSPIPRVNLAWLPVYHFANRGCFQSDSCETEGYMHRGLRVFAALLVASVLIWLVAPNFPNPAVLPISLANVGIPLALAGVWLWLFAQQLGRHPLVPINDPYFKNMLLHGHEGGH